MNAQRLQKLRKDCLTDIGHVATVFVAAFPIANGALQCIYILPMQVDGWGRVGVRLQRCTRCFTTDLVPPLTKAQCTFISAGFQIANNKKQEAL